MLTLQGYSHFIMINGNGGYSYGVIRSSGDNLLNMGVSISTGFAQAGVPVQECLCPQLPSAFSRTLIQLRCFDVWPSLIPSPRNVHPPGIAACRIATGKQTPHMMHRQVRRAARLAVDRYYSHICHGRAILDSDSRPSPKPSTSIDQETASSVRRPG